MNRSQRAIVIAGAFVILVLLGVGSWTFTQTERSESMLPSSMAGWLDGESFPLGTWEESSQCSILLGRDSTFDSRVANCDVYYAWREPILVALGATAIMTLLAVLWCATPRLRADDHDDGDSDRSGSPGPTVDVNPSSAAPSPPVDGEVDGALDELVVVAGAAAGANPGLGPMARSTRSRPAVPSERC